jgi:SdiA-regulated
MNRFRMFFTIAFGAIFIAMGVNVYAQNLEIVSIKQLSDPYGFDYSGSQPINLSGMAAHGGRVFIVGDNPSARYLYEVRETPTHWRMVSQVDLKFPNQVGLDLEGAFNSVDGLFLVNEHSGLDLVYKYSFDGRNVNRQPISVRFPDRFDANSWRNAGLEGVAYDTESNSLYLAKERDPPRIFVYRVSPGDGSTRFVKAFQIPSQEGTSDGQSYADLYFEAGFLYVLERRSYTVVKVDPDSEQVVARVSFEKLRHNGEALYKGDKGYGLAEALLLTYTELLIGLDNNGKHVNTRNQWVQKFDLQGKQPAIVRLSRPDGF